MASVRLKSLLHARIGLAILTAVSGISQVYGQRAVEPDNNQRLIQSMTQLAAAVSIKKGLAADGRCSGKKFRTIPLEEYFNTVAEMDEKTGKKEKLSPSKTEFAAMIEQMVNAEIPGKGTVWKVTYDTMFQNIENARKTIPGEPLCESLNTAAEGLYQKSKDNLRLIKL